MKERTSWIDGLKGIAILTIIARHSGVASVGGTLGTVASVPWGTQLFFVLSAMMAYASFERAVSGNTGTYIKASFKWIAKRILSLAPIFYLAVGTYLLLGDTHSYWLGEGGKITVGNVLSHLTFTFGFFPHYMNSILQVEWYLGVIVIFYLLMPLIYKLVCSLEKAVVLFLVSIGITAFVIPVVATILPGGADSGIYSQYIYSFSLPAQCVVLSSGIVMYYLEKKTDFSKIDKRKLLSYSILLFAAILLWGECLDVNNISLITRDSYFGIVGALIVLACICYPVKLIDNKLFALLGKYIYPIYLFHMLFIYLYEKYLHISVGINFVDWIIKFVLVIAVSFGVAIGLTKFVDEPLRKRIKF